MDRIMNEQTYPWYMVNKDGMATLCADHADAEQEAKNAQEVWPHMGPHRAVRLVEASQAFTAADMATAAAQGFREGQAAELAAMRAGGGPVAWAWNHSRAPENEAPQPSPTPQADSQPAPLSRQQICDKFSFLEGMVNEWGFDRIVSRAEEIQARAIAARAQAYIAPAGGLVSVPSEPTAEMYRAAQKFVYSTGEDGGSIVLNTSQVRALWQAMRAAAASTAVSVSEPVFAFRRKGLDDFCTCTEKRYAELSAKPNLFETRIFYTTPPTQAADSVLEDAETALRKVLGVVQRYLPPDGPSAHDAMSEIIAIVDPWPLGPLEKP